MAINDVAINEAAINENGNTILLTALPNNTESTLIAGDVILNLTALPNNTESTLAVSNVKHLAIVQSTEHQAITTYSNFNFDYSCNFKGKTLFASSNGMFEYGGTTDNGTEIIAKIKTDKSNKITGQSGLVPSQNRKRIPTSKFYINMEKTGDSVLKLTFNDDLPLEYPITNQKDGLQVYMRKIGRKQLYNSIQIEVEGFNILESIEFEPEEVRRRGGKEN